MIYRFMEEKCYSSQLTLDGYSFFNKEKRYVKNGDRILIKDKDLLLFLDDFYSRKDAAFFIHLRTGKITALFVEDVERINCDKK